MDMERISGNDVYDGILAKETIGDTNYRIFGQSLGDNPDDDPACVEVTATRGKYRVRADVTLWRYVRGRGEDAHWCYEVAPREVMFAFGDDEDTYRQWTGEDWHKFDDYLRESGITIADLEAVAEDFANEFLADFPPPVTRMRYVMGYY
jgi:hypothetical protein